MSIRLCAARGIAVVIVGLFISSKLWAQDAALTERERALLETVERLEKRLSAVEDELAALRSAEAERAEDPEGPDQAALDERITALEAERSSGLQATWSDGLRFQDPGGQFDLRIGGRLFVDFAWFDQDDDLRDYVFDEQDGGQIRLARLNFQGNLYEDFFYRFEYELAGNNGPSGFTDAFVGMKGIPYLGRVVIGHFKEPFGLEELTSNSSLTFMDRAATSAFTPVRNLGVKFQNAFWVVDDVPRMTYAAGVFKETDNWPSANDADEDRGWSVTGRVTGVPWYSEEPWRLLHLGAAYSLRNPDGATVNPYGLRPVVGSRLAQYRWLDTEGFEGFRLRDARVDDVNLLGLEAALMYGPFSAQAEYMKSDVDSAFGGELDFDGYYLYGTYTITGEHRAYGFSNGVMGRPRPSKNFAPGKGGWGAWELAARYAALDLDDAGVRGGELREITLGLNWYLNPNLRWMLNYTMSDVDRTIFGGDINVMQMRFQVDF